jgi:hypothetical protein
MYYYNLHCRVVEGSNWHGIKLLSIHAYRTIQLTFQQMRLYEHSHDVPIIQKSGWHLSYFGDVDFIINKISNFSHQEYNNETFLNKDKLKYNIDNHIKLLDDSELVYIPIDANHNLTPQYELYLTQYIIK